MFKVLDLFSGAGGFSLGLDFTGKFSTKIAVDFNKAALETISINNKEIIPICGDISDSKIKEKIIETAMKENINCIIGGPPCQGFSLKGKNLGLEDPRNFLFRDYLNLVEKIRPEVFIIENVKNLISSSEGYFINEIVNYCTRLGYHVNYGILNASDFGVPQNRERAIILACKSKKLNLPAKFATKSVTVRDAISDLAFLESGQGQFKQEYLLESQTTYQNVMRKESEFLYNHNATNHSAEALKKLKMIPPESGKEFLPKEYWGKQKFKTTWSRLEWDKCSPTIDTRFDTPSNGRNSHPFLHRSITPREAARIQSFPDTYIFYGSKTEICKQIGNAVPPLLAKKIGETVYAQFKEEKCVEKTYTLFNSDALAIYENFLKENILFDHIITDPPYNISVNNNFATMSNKKTGIDFGNWDKNFDLYSWIDKYHNLLSPNGSIIIFCSYKYISHLIDKLESVGFEIKDVLKWIKQNPMPRNTSRRYVQDTEYAIWAVKKGAKWIFNKPNEKPYLRAEFTSPVVSGNEKNGHPTQKSLKVLEEIIKIHTNEGQKILDPFMGSGTTGEAALINNRFFYGVEIDHKYFQLAKKRMEKYKTSKK